MKSQVMQAVNATEELFQEGEGLLNQIIKDFTPDTNGKVKGVSIGTVTKAIGFAVSHPITTFNLFRFAKSSKVIQVEALESLIKNKTIWNFVKSNADSFEGVGGLLAKAGMSEFQPGGILDRVGLGLIKNAFKEDQSLQLMQDILLTSLQKNFDPMSFAEKVLDLISNDHFSKYFNNKGEAIADYIKNGPNKEIFAEYFQTYNIDPKIINVVPNFVNKIPQIKDILIKLSDEGLVPAVFDSLHMINSDPKLSQFFQDNEAFISDCAKALIEKTPTLKSISEGFKFDTELLNIADVLSSKPELRAKITTAFITEDYVELAKVFTEEFNQNTKVQEYIKNNKDSIVKLVSALHEKVPIIKYNVAPYINLKDLTSICLDNPQSIVDIVSNFTAGEWKKGLVSLMSPILSSGIKNIAVSYVSQDSAKSSKIANEILSDISQTNSKYNFRKTVFQALDTKSKNFSINTIFDNIVINPPKLLEIVADINGTSFIKSKFSNISFGESIITNCSFLGAEFSDPEIFKKSTLDGETLKSLIPQIKSGEISLNGVKIVGSLAGADLSNINLINCDLSEVTMLRGTNFKNTNCQNTKLPSDPNLFTHSYNLAINNFPEKYISNDIIKSSLDYITEKAFKDITHYAIGAGYEAFSKDAQKLIIQNTKSFENSNAQLNQNMQNLLLKTPIKDLSKADRDKFINFMYENLNPYKLDEQENKVISTLAFEVGYKLFKDGVSGKRLEDTMLIEKTLRQAVINDKIKNQETKSSLVTNLTGKNDTTIEMLTKLFYDASSHTNAGIFTGGIYINPNKFDNNFKFKLKTSLSDVTESKSSNLSFVTKFLGNQSKSGRSI